MSADSNQSRPLAMIGMGRMGGNMARRLSRAGHPVHAYDPQARPEQFSSEANVTLHGSLAATVEALATPRIIWLMLPAGPITDDAILQLQKLLSKGDLIVDGGNANYLQSQAQGKALEASGIDFADCGVSGGIWGLEIGYCLMFGAGAAAMQRLQPIARSLAVSAESGWLHCGPVGAGHFSKMIHNGVEYGMMQALAEGFALLKGNPSLNVDLAAVAELWRHGSVVRSWLLDLTAQALKDPNAFESVGPLVADSGEGRWTVDEAIRQGTPVPVIAMALMSRFDSQGRADDGNKLLSLMRRGFGGHATEKATS